MRSLIRVLVALAMSLAVTAPAQAAWYEAKSKHFIIDANENPKELREYAEKLERFDQAVRYIRDMSDSDLTDSERVRIYVLPSPDAVARLAGNDMVRGFYHTRASGWVAFVPRFSGDGPLDPTTEEIFFHEYAHHLHLQDSSIAMPEWVREGFAEFFAPPGSKRTAASRSGLRRNIAPCPYSTGAASPWRKCWEVPTGVSMAGVSTFFTQKVGCSPII